MRNLTVIICFLSFNLYCQSKDTIYLLINKKDTLVKKIEHKEGSPEYYMIFFTEKSKTLKNNTPLIDGKVWVADTKYDYYFYERASYNFNFLGKKREISELDLKSLNFIDNREEFLKKGRLIFNSFLFFIEPSNNKFIMRQVYPITYE